MYLKLDFEILMWRISGFILLNLSKSKSFWKIFHRTHWKKIFPHPCFALHCLHQTPALSLAFVKMENDEEASSVDECSDDFKVSAKIKEKAKEKLMFKEEVGAHFWINLNLSYHYHFIWTYCLSYLTFKC